MRAFFYIAGRSIQLARWIIERITGGREARVDRLQGIFIPGATPVGPHGVILYQTLANPDKLEPDIEAERAMVGR